MRVVIIGGGMAGVSLGYELASHAAVTVLEAERTLAAHSTGRSAALFVADYGPATVRALTRAGIDAFQRFETELGTPQLLLPRGVLMTAWDEPTADLLTEMIENKGSALRPVTVEQARRICPALSGSGLLSAALDVGARDIDVMALHAGYLRGVRRRGGQIHSAARVVRAERARVGWRLTCADNRTFDADVVVNAAGAWGDHVAALCGVSGLDLTPCRRTVVIARPTRPIDPTWPVVADAAEAWYFKPEGAALLLSPGDETPVEAGDTKPDPLDVATVLERVNAVTDLGLRSVQTAWAGLRTFAPDRSPIVGAHPDEPSLFCFLGQGGFGIQIAPALAVAGAELLRTGRITSTTGCSAEELAPGRFRLQTSGRLAVTGGTA
jgi:D-arginine dehydrogenase